MKRSHFVLALVSVLALTAFACDRLQDPATLLDGGNALTSSEAAKSMVGVLEPRTFRDENGFTHGCGEYATSLIMGSWESDTESWLLTFASTYQPGTRIFRFYEVDSAFDQIMGPPLDEECWTN